MKINWGYKIAILYGIFIVIVLSMASFFMMHDIDLVTPGYYDNAIGYQNKIDIIKRTENLPEKIKFIQGQSDLTVRFPKNIDGKNITGEVLFFRPSNAKKDRQFPISPDADNRMIINLARFEKGFWKIQLNWKVQDTEYYNEDFIHLQ
ncbi:MAG: FixH family protein [Ignavibacteria bacterium]